MTSILSITASSLVAARVVREAGGELSRTDLLDRLDAAGITDPIRREAAIRHAVHERTVASQSETYRRRRRRRPHSLRSPRP